VVLHSEEYKSSKGFAGHAGVVVGSANTAHDIAEDMIDAGLRSVTMVQRSKTYVLPQEWMTEAQARLYNTTVPVDLADKLSYTYPNAVFRLMNQAIFHAYPRANPTRFEALEKSGFRVDVFGDPAYHLHERLGGHYIDIGASAKIAAGKVLFRAFSWD
jgi:cation diffusion facilitator CzcD-associated flavoprotein CzcO